jgi:hypothetical protein
MSTLPEETRAITREPFVEWLKALPPDTKFGRGTCECPLAQFSGCQVGWVSYDKGHLPDWACVFVERFLKRRGPKNARRALQIMEALS